MLYFAWMEVNRLRVWHDTKVPFMALFGVMIKGIFIAASMSKCRNLRNKVSNTLVIQALSGMNFLSFASCRNTNFTTLYHCTYQLTEVYLYLIDLAKILKKMHGRLLPCFTLCALNRSLPWLCKRCSVHPVEQDGNAHLANDRNMPVISIRTSDCKPQLLQMDCPRST